MNRKNLLRGKGGVALDWFSSSNEKYVFEMYSMSHLVILAILVFISATLFMKRDKLQHSRLRPFELTAAWSLFFFELAFQAWLAVAGNWKASDSIPLELCSISLILTIILLITEKKLVYELLLFTALLGASQALLTPLLFFDFPHFRYFHFFYTHMMMIWAVLYFTWIKGYRPTIYSVLKVFIFFNILLPVVIMINKLTGGNYMFLSHKPETASLLDYLGPYPWYILSLEGMVIVLSLLVWLVFRDKGKIIQFKRRQENSRQNGE
jgi:hypothetical integral membrane protein (TIGR02206 family)